MRRKVICKLAVILVAWAASLPAQSWRAGVAKISITPQMSVWMAGYGSRDKPSQGVAQELYAKALVIEDPGGSRIVVITSDLIGFTREITDKIADEAGRRFSLPRERLVFSSSHTHTGPTLGHSLPIMYELTPQQAQAVQDHTRYLEQQVVAVIGKALEDLAPAQLSFHHGRAGFAMNRREATPEGIKLGVNPKGPVDHDVPALRVTSPDGKLRAVLFSYACHNTTLTGNYYEFHGDYAGFAQEFIERDHPGTIALFMIGCGGDANPFPRGEIENARQNGGELASAVAQAVGGSGRPIQGKVAAEYIHFVIPLAPPPSRSEFEARLNDSDRFVRRHAAYHLKLLEGQAGIPREYSYPLQAVQLGGGLTLVALGGEVVVEYGLQLKQRLGEESTWPVGYTNDVFAYIPTKKMLTEGGYEADRSQVYYGMPGPWAPEIEETILSKATELVQRVRGGN